MIIEMLPKNSGNSLHRWRFFRSGGIDQVRLETGADLMALDQLDQKLWMALSCPTKGLEFDGRTLELIDTDNDGRIRVPDIIAAVQWAGSLLKNPDTLTAGSAELPLASFNDQSPEGKRLLDAARAILINIGKPDATAIGVEDTADEARILAQTKFNGDGIITIDATETAPLQHVITDIIDCLGSEMDRSGKPGISREKVDQFFSGAQGFSDWWKEAETDSANILPLGEATLSAAVALLVVRGKVEDYFTRCRLAKYDIRALCALNRQESEYIAIAEKSLSTSLEELSDFPIAQIGCERTLPLQEGINPAWSSQMAAFVEQVIDPLLGKKESLTEGEWKWLCGKFAAYEAWQMRKTGSAIEKLGIERVRNLLAPGAREAIETLIARDASQEAVFNNIASVDKLVRYHSFLFRLLNNFVSFSDFYSRRIKAVFQAGTLYLDGRSCDLCIRVDDAGRHAPLATLSRTYLAYCDCTRKGGNERMTIAAAFTDGDSDYLMVGRNGVFYDRKGEDWDATIIRLIEHPISIRQAFWSPYKRVAKMISEQIAKMASSRDKAVTDHSSATIAGTGQKVDASRPPVPAQPFDAAKYAGIFAAIGLAVGAIGTAIAAAVTGFMSLVWWKMPLVLAGLMLLISGPSMIIAWLKLRQRTIGPILDANGWAINARVRINVAFGGSLTKVAALPEGAARSLEDPFADRKSLWPKLILLLGLLLILFYLFNRQGLIQEWVSRVF
jgi:hypothetical protein